MAQKTDTKEPEIRTSIEGLDGIFDAAELSPALAVLYADLGIADGAQQTKVQIDFRRPDDGVFARVHSGSADSYDLMDIARRFGSGDYRIQLRGPEPHGRMVIRGQAIIPVLLDAEEQERIDAKRNPVVVTPPQPPVDVAAIVQAIAAAQPKQPDLIETLIKLAPVVTPLLTALRAPAPVPAPPIAHKTALEQLAETVQATTIMRQLREMQDEGAGGNVADALDESGLLRAGLEAFKTIAAKQDATVATIDHSTQAPVVEQPAQRTLTPEEEEMSLQLRLLLAAAAMKKDVRVTAEQIYNNAPDAILQVLESPNWETHLYAVLPDAAKHAEWFNQVRDIVVSIIKEESNKSLRGKKKQDKRTKSPA